MRYHQKCGSGKCGSGKCDIIKNAGVENAGVKNAGSKQQGYCDRHDIICTVTLYFLSFVLCAYDVYINKQWRGNEFESGWRGHRS